MEELQAPNTTYNNAQNPSQNSINNSHTITHHIHGHEHKHDHHVEHGFFEDIDSTCSTPYVSAPSSPGRGSGPVNGGFYYSAPASPMHFAFTASYPILSPDNTSSVALGFEFGSGSATDGSMISADELFLNGKIRPMKLSTHLERPQVLAPLLDLENEDEEETEGEMMDHELGRGRDLRVVRDKSMRRRTRSLSPLRSSSLKWNEESGIIDDDDDVKELKSGSCLDNVSNLDKSDDSGKSNESTAAETSLSASSSRSSSAGRSSKRWVFLKDFLYRSKSEGRSNNKFWSSITFSPILKEKIKSSNSIQVSAASKDREANNVSTGGSAVNNQTKSKGKVKKPVNGIGKRRMPPSPHELHYTANRAQAEEMRKKTFLPYRQGLLSCLGFSSKGYGAMNGIARALNPVSSR